MLIDSIAIRTDAERPSPSTRAETSLPPCFGRSLETSGSLLSNYSVVRSGLSNNGMQLTREPPSIM